MNGARAAQTGYRRFPAPAGALLLVLLLGCAGPTPYQKRDAGEGYHDYETRPGVHFLSFDGNGSTSRETVLTYWHRRAAEICGGPDRYEVLGMDASGKKIFVDGPTVIREYTLPHVEGLIRCRQSDSRHSRTFFARF